MKYEFKKLTKSILQATKANWIDLLTSLEIDFNPSGYYQFLDSSEAKLNKTSTAPDSHCYVVTRSNNNVALGMFDIVHAMPKSPESWVKVLAMRTSPSLDLRVPEAPKDSLFDRREQIGEIIPFGLVNVLGTTYSTHKCNKIKIWGNKQVDIDIFTTLKNKLQRDQKFKKLGFQFNEVGNWLEITKPN